MISAIIALAILFVTFGCTALTYLLTYFGKWSLILFSMHVLYSSAEYSMIADKLS